MRSLRLAAFLSGLLCSSVFSVAGPQATSGNPDLDLGVQGYEKGRYEEAIQHFKQAVDRDPTLLAVIDWTQAYQPRMEEHAKLGLKPEERLEDKKVCAALKENNSVNIQEGIDNLTQALKLRPDYDDAMACMNLIYRERADLQCDDPAARGARCRPENGRRLGRRYIGGQEGEGREAARFAGHGSEVGGNPARSIWPLPQK